MIACGLRFQHALLLLALLLWSMAGCARQPLGPLQPDVPTPLPIAYMIGETTTDAATLWVRCAGADEVVVSLAPSESTEIRAAIEPERDDTVRIVLDGLQPATQYRYTLWCRGGEARAPGTGSFETAPAPDQRAAVRFAWSGDVGGQNACRDHEQGYLPYRAVRGFSPDFFIALGDMIYADDACLAEGRYGNSQIAGPATPALDVDGFRAHWRYARADVPLQLLHGATTVYATWDDHEIVDDAGPRHDTPPGRRGPRLLPLAREAFFDYHPLASEPDGTPLYRNFRWGRHVEIFVLDTRSYRDSNRSRDSEKKSMLGAAQREWLRDALLHSDATWKVIVSSVPLAIPTGSANARDGWSGLDGNTGFTHELTEILQTLQRLTRRQILWLTADVHFGSVLRYTPFPDDPDFVFHEVVTGPLNAGIFPKRDLDRTFHPERLYFHGPEDAGDVADWVEALRWFNFGTAEVDEAGVLTLRLVSSLGEPAYELQLLP